MCDIGKAFSRAFTAPGTGGVEAALIQGQADLTRQAEAARIAGEKALKLQEDALKRAEAAAVPLADSESARRAGEDRLRKLLAGGGFGVKPGTDFFGQAPLGYRMLTGA